MFYRRYIDSVKTNGLKYDVVIITSVVKPQIAYAISEKRQMNPFNSFIHSFIHQ